MHTEASTAALTLPHKVFQWRIPVLIGLLALGGLVTQAFGILTDRDSVLGIIPKFNPGGARNIPVWLSSVTFAIGACLTGATALTTRRKHTREWWILTGILLVLSAERMAFPNRGMQSVIFEVLGFAFVMALVLGFAFVSVAAYLSCLRELSRAISFSLMVAGTAFLIGAVASGTAVRPDVSAGVAERALYVVIMTAGRLLELAGLTLFVRSMISHLRSQGHPLVVTIDSSARRMVETGSSAGPLEFRISPIRVRRFLFWIIALILSASTIVTLAHLFEWNTGTLYAFLNVDVEGNLPTWWSVLLLASCGLVSGAIASARHHADDPDWRRWLSLAFLFCLLSLDEAASFHEMLVMPLRDLVNQNPWLRYPLILPGIVAVAAAFLAFRPFLRALPSEFRRALLMGVGLFLLGALGVETVGGWFDPLVIGPNVTYIALGALEEGCEMVGATVIFVGLLHFVERSLGRLRVFPPHPSVARIQNRN